MIIKRYGIELHRIKHSDIELIRTMRNRADIRARMFDQKSISKNQQEKWFKSINNMHNFFFLICYQGQYIGLLQGKDIDFNNREAEGGIFVWEQSIQGTGVPAKASICLMEASFSVLLMQKIYARTRKDNMGAWQYNLSLGYAPALDKGEDYMLLTKEAYEKNADRFRYYASGKKNTSAFSIMNDLEIPNASKYRHLYEGLPEDILSPLKPKLLKPNGWL